MPPKKDSHGTLIFKDHPDFTPNLTPREMFQAGVFGGTYFRPIESGVTKKSHQNAHSKFPKSWFWGLNKEEMVTSSICRPRLNRYKVKSGSSLEDWEKKGWIKAQDPYGWVEWYCHFYLGRRTSDDQRQIDRWKGVANGRFRNRLINMCDQKKKKFDDESVSPVIRQLLLQWGYELTKRDYDNYLKSNK